MKPHQKNNNQSISNLQRKSRSTNRKKRNNETLSILVKPRRKQLRHTITSRHLGHDGSQLLLIVVFALLDDALNDRRCRPTRARARVVAGGGR